MFALETSLRKNAKLEPSLVALVKMRASQINGCAYCLDMHSKDARAAGETEQRLYTLNAWRETPFFTDRERAALAWTEAVTMVSADHVPDAVYEQIRQLFSEAEIVNLTMVIVAINGRNRLMILSRRARRVSTSPAKITRSKPLIPLKTLLCLAASLAPATAADVNPLLTKDLPGTPGKEAMMLTVAYAPGESSAAHRHNANTFVYVLEGSIVMQVKGGKEVTLQPGETFYESPDDVHSVSRNASTTNSAKFLVFFVKDKGASTLVPVP